MVLLLRHASAGERLSSPDRDRERRLDAVGRTDARRLSETLGGYGIERIVTSPYTRCVETLDPLAARLGLEVALADELAPGASRDEVVALLETLRGGVTLACTHREVFETLFGPDGSCEKGAAWLLERGSLGWYPDTYHSPPSSHGLARAAAVVALP